MAVFSDLPEETVLQILEQIAAAEGDASKLLPVITVDKQFHRLARPLLYRDISNRDFMGPKLDAYLALRKLTMTLIKDPTKAALVRALRLLDFKDVDNPEIGQVELMDEEGYDSASAMIEHAFRGDDEKRNVWMDRLQKGKDEKEASFSLTPYLLALMIAHLPNLCDLTILDTTMNSNERQWPIIAEVVQAMAQEARKTNATGPLSRLESVTTGGEAPEYPHPTNQLWSIAKLPNVKHVHGLRVGDGDNSFDENPSPERLVVKPRSANFTSVSFRPRCKLLGEHLIRFLGAAKALEEFDYLMGHAWSWIPFHAGQLYEALAQHQDTLREITLHVSDEVEDTEGSTWPSPDFSKFTQLRKLEIATPFIFGPDIRKNVDPEATASKIVDMLPPSIYSFDIVGGSSESEVVAANKAVLNVLTSKDQKFPDLRSMTIAVAREVVPYYRKLVGETMALAKEHEVYFGGRIASLSADDGLNFQSLDSGEDSEENVENKGDEDATDNVRG